MKMKMQISLDPVLFEKCEHICKTQSRDIFNYSL